MINVDRQHLGLMMEAGYVFLGMQRFKQAREVFEGICALAPDSEIPVIAVGSVDFCEGKFANAIRQYKKALKKDPASLYAVAYMGESLFFMGKKDEAVKTLKEVSQKDPQGKAGDFSRALLSAIDKGFTPQSLSGVDELKAHYKKKEQAKR